MQLRYYPDTNSLYVDMMPGKPGAETFEIQEGLIVDVDADDNVVGYDVDISAYGQGRLAVLDANGDISGFNLSRAIADFKSRRFRPERSGAFAFATRLRRLLARCRPVKVGDIHVARNDNGSEESDNGNVDVLRSIK